MPHTRLRQNPSNSVQQHSRLPAVRTLEQNGKKKQIVDQGKKGKKQDGRLRKNGNGAIGKSQTGAGRSTGVPCDDLAWSPT